jgi:hypothetical protein
MLERARRSFGRWALLGSLAVCLAVVLFNVALAAGQGRPAIVGAPVVGTELSVSFPSGTSGFDGLYQWQSCDPSVANCSDVVDHNDPNWSDLPPSDSDLHNNSTYTIVSSDLGHFIRVLAHDNSLGEGTWATSPPIGPVTNGAAQPPPPLEPEHGISFLVQPAAGSVTIKEPGQSGYAPLNGLEKVPVNSIVDTRGGTVKLTAATGDLGDTTEDKSVRFWDGLIRIQQGTDHNALATAKLVEKLRCPKGGGAEAKVRKSSGPVATTSRKRRRRVWGSGSGNYSSSGSGGTGSVRGTTWLTKDTCRGTFFKVTEGIGISVFDLDLNQTFELGPGQSYFARNR